MVWGCERPELLITETLAFHDLRQEDLKIDSNVQYGSTDHSSGTTGPGKDRNPDQRLFPKGSFFVELYNPWVTQSSNTNVSGFPAANEVPGELYNDNSTTGLFQANTTMGVQLNAVSPGDNKSPVWRLLIVKPSVVAATGKQQDPDDPVYTNRPQPSNIERSIYFIQNGATNITGHGTQYYPLMRPRCNWRCRSCPVAMRLSVLLECSMGCIRRMGIGPLLAGERSDGYHGRLTFPI